MEKKDSYYFDDELFDELDVPRIDTNDQSLVIGSYILVNTNRRWNIPPRKGFILGFDGSFADVYNPAENLIFYVPIDVVPVTIIENEFSMDQLTALLGLAIDQNNTVWAYFVSKLIKELYGE